MLKIKYSRILPLLSLLLFLFPALHCKKKTPEQIVQEYLETMCDKAASCKLPGMSSKEECIKFSSGLFKAAQKDKDTKFDRKKYDQLEKCAKAVRKMTCEDVKADKMSKIPECKL